jgi:dTDP-4-dehydrorhamnose reductase
MRPPVIGTGLSGLVGSRLVELLSDQFTFSDLSLESGVDITRFDSLEGKIKNSQAEVVLHLAAFTDVDQAWEQRGDEKGSCYQVNVIGTRNLAQLCAQYGKYLIHISTDYVFDGQNPPAGGYTEEDKPHPLEWYGETKYLAEQEVEKSGAKFSLVRIAFPFRAKFGPKRDLVRTIIQKMREDRLPPMFTDQKITPTFIDDIAAGLAIFIQKRPEGIYHLVGSSILSPYELACEVAEIFSFDKEKIKKGSLAEFLKTNLRPRGFNIGLSNQRVKEKLGIKMKTTREALQIIKEQTRDEFD